jgi:hypothetical protein
MVKKSSELKKNLIFFLTGLFFSSCANQLPPGGGEVDKIPPEIIELFPEDGTINFNENYFEIGFSEYVDKRSVKDAIFISPAIDGELELNWSGKYVQVSFPSSLKKNTTYVITLGTDVVDFNNKNRMAQSFSFTFSTGDKIDRRIISGRVYDEKPDGVMMFAYKLDTAVVDPSVLKPDYVSQCGSDGNYKLLGLSAGTYRVFAVKDEFRDLLYNIEQDKIGVPPFDVILKEEDSLYTGLNFFLTQQDTTPPRILTAAMTDRNHILINVSEEFDSSIVQVSNFSVIDSTTNKIVDLKYSYRQSKKNNEIVLVITDSLKETSDYYLQSKLIKDLFGNAFTNDVVSLTINEKADTSKPGIDKTIPNNNSSTVDYTGSEFNIFFSDAIDSNLVKHGINFTDTLGKAVQYEIYFPDDASIRLKPVKDLEVQKDYQIKIDLNKAVDIAGNKYDSVYTLKFKTINGLDFTGVSGVVKNSEPGKSLQIVLQNTSDKNVLYQTKVSEENGFNIERVEAGKYLLWARTTTEDGTYHYGDAYPFKPADWFKFYPDTLELRPRWSLLDLQFDAKK